MSRVPATVALERACGSARDCGPEVYESCACYRGFRASMRQCTWLRSCRWASQAITWNGFPQGRSIDVRQRVRAPWAGSRWGHCSSLQGDIEVATGRYWSWLHGDIEAVMSKILKQAGDRYCSGKMEILKQAGGRYCNGKMEILQAGGRYSSRQEGDSEAGRTEMLKQAGGRYCSGKMEMLTLAGGR